eukprot:2598152-Rhodomonas_salina.2
MNTTLLISNSRFNFCSASGQGGALFLTGERGRSTLEKVDFVRCSALEGGAVAVCAGAELRMDS